MQLDNSNFSLIAKKFGIWKQFIKVEIELSQYIYEDWNLDLLRKFKFSSP